MKRYINSGVTYSPEYYVAVVLYNETPIGYVCEKHGDGGLNIQVNPNDTTKAHGVMIGTKRSIIQKLSIRYDLDHWGVVPEIRILDGGQVIGRYRNLENPFYYARRRSLSTAATCPLIPMDISDFKFDVIPADEDIDFSSISSITDVHDPLSETIPYLEELADNEGCASIIAQIFAKHSVEEVENNGLLAYIREFPQYAQHVKDWLEEQGLEISQEISDAIYDGASNLSIEEYLDERQDDVIDHIINEYGDHKSTANIYFLYAPEIVDLFEIPNDSATVSRVGDYLEKLINEKDL